MAFISRGGYMLSHATIGKVAQSRGIGMLKRIIPFIRKGHGNGDRLFGLYVNVHVPRRLGRDGKRDRYGSRQGQVGLLHRWHVSSRKFSAAHLTIGRWHRATERGKRDFHGFIYI